MYPVITTSSPRRTSHGAPGAVRRGLLVPGHLAEAPNANDADPCSIDRDSLTCVHPSKSSPAIRSFGRFCAVIPARTASDACDSWARFVMLTEPGAVAER